MEILGQFSAEIDSVRYQPAFVKGDPENADVWFGEAAAIIRSIGPAWAVAERITTEAVASRWRYDRHAHWGGDDRMNRRGGIRIRIRVRGGTLVDLAVGTGQGCGDEVLDNIRPAEG